MLSTDARRRLQVATASTNAGNEVADAVDGQFGTPMAHIAPVGALTALPVSATAGGSTPTAAEVDVSVNALATAVHTELAALQAKIDAILAALVTDGKMAAS